ncbi:MAG: HD domain-containing protein [Saprospiraceae bacterium]|nr:HD domain-containing protein [Saprospiraceae bacterium]
MNYHAVKAFILDKLERELSDVLTYHGLHHTLDVLHVAEELCYLEKISPYETILVKTAALFHDSGFTVSGKEHERLGCQLAKIHLPEYGYTPSEVRRICGMIMATKIPQSPKNELEQIICDADLDYLGRDDFYDIGGTLYEELRANDVLNTEQAWNQLQVQFLEKHHFFTETARRRRTARKQRYLNELKRLVASYEKK